MAPDCGSCAHDAPKESGLVGPTCCCASFLRPFDWPASWPGSALLRLKGGAPDSAQNAENSKSKTKVKTVVFGLKRVIPVSENAPENATALAVSEAGTILALGSDEEILAKYGNDAEEKIELKGKTVVPGFIDVHTHPTMYAVGAHVVHSVSMFDCPTKSDVLAKIANLHASTPGNDLLAFQGFNHSIQSPDRTFIMRDELDEISKERPIMITHNTGHFIICNSAAFALAGIDESSPDQPGGGKFQKYPDGRKNGVCEESLVNFFSSYYPKPGPEEMSRLLGITLKESFARRGLTTIAEAWVPGVEKTEQALGVFELLEASGEMHVRVGFHPNTLQTPRPPEVVEILKAKGYTQTVPGAPMFSPSAPSNGHLLAVSGIKMLSDASGQGKTAFVSEPYKAPPEGNVGGLNFPPEEIHSRLAEIKSAGLSPMVHAIGDRAQDVVLDGFEKHWGPKSEYEKTGGWRLRLEHVTVSREDEYPRMKEMGVYPSFMSSFYYWLGEYCYNEAFGPTLRERMVTFRSAQSHDLIWNVHSDTPVVPIQPVRDWQVMVDRKTHSGKIYSPEQTVSRQEALRALTINGAIALGVDQVTGSLEVGKYADFAVLAEDPWEIETDKLGSIAVDETWLVGRRRVWTD